jgi:hypothetical protein
MLKGMKVAMSNQKVAIKVVTISKVETRMGKLMISPMMVKVMEMAVTTWRTMGTIRRMVTRMVVIIPVEMMVMVMRILVMMMMRMVRMEEEEHEGDEEEEDQPHDSPIRAFEDHEL